MEKIKKNISIYLIKPALVGSIFLFSVAQARHPGFSVNDRRPSSNSYNNSNYYLQPIQVGVPPTGFARLSLIRPNLLKNTGTKEVNYGDINGLAKYINIFVNQKIRPQAESRTGPDQWTQYNFQDLNKKQSLLQRITGSGSIKGDCEDYVLTKRQMLLDWNIPSGNLLIATAYIPDGSYHALLVVRTTIGDLVLDNLTDEIKPFYLTGYRFHMLQSPENPSLWYLVK